MKGAVGLAAVGLLLASQAEGHGNPYVLFASRFVDTVGRPVSGLTVRIATAPAGRHAGGILVEAPIGAGSASIAVPFVGDFAGELRLNVIDAKHRVISMLPPTAEGPRRASTAVFAYSHHSGEPLRSALAWHAQPPFRAADVPDEALLKDGDAVLGGDGHIREGKAVAPAFRLDWMPERIEPGEAAEAARGAELDRGIERAFRERLSAIRQGRAGK